MKKTLITMAVAGASLAAFAQGKVSLQNDSGSAATLAAQAGSPASDNSGKTMYPLAADNSVAGAPISTAGPLPSGITLEVGLYGGATSGSLTLQTHVLLNAGSGNAAGVYGIAHCVTSYPGYTAGSAAFFQVEVWDSAYATPLLAQAAGSYFGEDNIFSMTPSTSIAYPGINSGGNTTWAAVGNEAPLVVGITSIPEPATFALAGLGAAAMVIFRRRK